MAFVLVDFTTPDVAVRTALNSVSGFFATVLSTKNTLVSALEDKSLAAQVATAEGIFATLKANIELAQRQLMSLHGDVVLDRTIVRINFPGIMDEASYEETMREIFGWMVSDPSTITANVVTLSSITKTVDTSTAGNLYLTKQLPGNIAPGTGFMQHYQLYDRTTEMTESDNVVAVIRTPGVFSVSGRTPQAVAYGGDTSFGNDGVLYVPSDGSANLVLNFFETFTSDIPDGWTAVTGAGATEFQASTTTYMIGAKSLRIQGTTELTYPIASLVQGRQMLLLSIWLLKGTGTTSGTYKLQCTGTGMTTQETSTFNATDLSTTVWGELTLHLKIPATIPSDLKIKVITTGVDTTDGMYLDGGILQPYYFWAGLGFAVTVGKTAFCVGDRFTFSPTNDYAGVHQTLLARHPTAKFQLPSA